MVNRSGVVFDRIIGSSDPELFVDHEGNLSSSQKPVLLLGFLFLETDLLLRKCRHWNCALIFVCVHVCECPSSFRDCFRVSLHVVRLNSLRMILG